MFSFSLCCWHNKLCNGCLTRKSWNGNIIYLLLVMVEFLSGAVTAVDSLWSPLSFSQITYCCFLVGEILMFETLRQYSPLLVCGLYKKRRSASCLISFHFGLDIQFCCLVAVFKLSAFQILGISRYLILPVCCVHWDPIELLFCMLNREKCAPTLSCTSCPLAEPSGCASQWLCCSRSAFILGPLTDVRTHPWLGLNQMPAFPFSLCICQIDLFNSYLRFHHCVSPVHPCRARFRLWQRAVPRWTQQFLCLLPFIRQRGRWTRDREEVEHIYFQKQWTWPTPQHTQRYSQCEGRAVVL